MLKIREKLGDISDIVVLLSRRDPGNSIIRMGQMRKVELVLLDQGTCAIADPERYSKYDGRALTYTPAAISANAITSPERDKERACYVNAIYKGSEEDFTGRMQHIVSPGDFLSQGVEGVVTRNRLLGMPDDHRLPMVNGFIIKTNKAEPPAKKTDPTYDFLHEAVIGLLVGNPMGELIPNFVQTYGYLPCGARGTDVLGMKELCHYTTKEINHLVIEDLGNSARLQEAHRDLTDLSYMLLLLQAYNALSLAHVLYGFVHGDLHSRNIMVRKLSAPMLVPIYDTVVTKSRFMTPISQIPIMGYVSVSEVPVFIDYSLSLATVEADGEHVTISRHDAYLENALSAEGYPVGSADYARYDGWFLLGTVQGLFQDTKRTPGPIMAEVLQFYENNWEDLSPSMALGFLLTLFYVVSRDLTPRDLVYRRAIPTGASPALTQGPVTITGYADVKLEIMSQLHDTRVDMRGAMVEEIQRQLLPVRAPPTHEFPEATNPDVTVATLTELVTSLVRGPFPSSLKTSINFVIAHGRIRRFYVTAAAIINKYALRVQGFTQPYQAYRIALMQREKFLATLPKDLPGEEYIKYWSDNTLVPATI